MIDELDCAHDAILEFLLGCDTDVAQPERPSLEKKPSTRLSQEPCVGVNTNSKRPDR
jgi:hypothetical protein